MIEDLKLPLPGDLKDISKASALVSGVIEDRIPALLNSVRNQTWDEDAALQAFEFRRDTIGFPDILLVERTDPTNVIFEIEAKSWYILSRDALTARFETSPEIMRTGTLVAIIAWILDGVVGGSVKLLRIHSDDAQRLAMARDEAWNGIEPPGSHRVVQPENPAGTPRNQLKTQARGEHLERDRWVKDADNYGKLDRLHDAALQKFRDDVWSLHAGKKTLKEWRTFITR